MAGRLRGAHQELGRLGLVQRDNGALAFRQEMSEAEHRSLFVLDVVHRCHANVSMTQHFLSSGPPIASIDLGAVFLAQQREASSSGSAPGIMQDDEQPEPVQDTPSPDDDENSTAPPSAYADAVAAERERADD
jgi:hypothetical protein